MQTLNTCGATVAVCNSVFHFFTHSATRILPILHFRFTAIPYALLVLIVLRLCALLLKIMVEEISKTITQYEERLRRFLLCSPIVIWTLDASGRRTERDVLHGSLLWRAYGMCHCFSVRCATMILALPPHLFHQVLPCIVIILGYAWFGFVVSDLTWYRAAQYWSFLG